MDLDSRFDGLLLGADVSHFNGAINWDDAATEISFVIVKATDGDVHVDSRFVENAKGAADAGLKVGAYHFLRPNKDALAQAKHFLTQYNLVGGIEGLSLGAAVDVEDPGDDLGAWNALTQGERISFVGSFLQAVQAEMDYLPLIYCGPKFWATMFGTPGDFSGHPLWAASPSGPPDLSGTDWTEYAIWQYDFKGTVSGIGKGNVDLDRVRAAVERSNDAP